MSQKRRHRRFHLKKETKQVLLGSAIFLGLAMIMVVLILVGVFT